MLTRALNDSPCIVHDIIAIHQTVASVVSHFRGEIKKPQPSNRFNGDLRNVGWAKVSPLEKLVSPICLSFPTLFNFQPTVLLMLLLLYSVLTVLTPYLLLKTDVL